MSDGIVPLNMLAGVNTFDWTHEGWTLNEPPTHDGNRTFMGKVLFEREFTGPPIVHFGIVGFDMSNEDFARLKVRCQHIHCDGFTLVAETWFDSQIFSVEISWIALGT